MCRDLAICVWPRCGLLVSTAGVGSEENARNTVVTVVELVIENG